MEKTALVYRGALLKSPLGEQVGETVSEKLIAIAQPLKIKSGSTLFKIEDKPDGLYLLLSGQLKLIRSGVDFREHIVHLVEEDEVFGETAIFLGSQPKIIISGLP